MTKFSLGNLFEFGWPPGSKYSRKLFLGKVIGKGSKYYRVKVLVLYRPGATNTHPWGTYIGAVEYISHERYMLPVSPLHQLAEAAE